MRKFELIVPVAYADAREALSNETTFLRRTRIEDTYFTRPDSDEIVRLRRQDTLAKLSCARRLSADEPAEYHETIVLDARACAQLLAMLGFRTSETVRLTRDLWKKHLYSLHLDRVENQGDFLTVETEVRHDNHRRLKKAAFSLLKALGIPFDKKLARAYTDPVK